MSKTNQAVGAFDTGFSCSQCILSTYCTDFHLDRETGLRLASPFGGGIGHMGNLCGAVTASLMVVGLKYGRTRAPDKAAQDKTDALVQEFIKRFSAHHGSLVCNTLVGLDISTPQGAQQFIDRKLRDTVCAGLVRDAAEILEAILKL